MKQSNDQKINVAVLCGGVSNEREISLLSGINVAQSLSRDKFRVSIIEINPQGKWFFARYGKAAKKLIRSESIDAGDKNSYQNKLQKFNVFFVALHGKMGEDGSIQKFLRSLKIPYTGSNAEVNAITFNKYQTNTLLAQKSVSIPHSICIDTTKQRLTEQLKSIQKDVCLPCIVKPNQSGSSIGITIVQKESDLPQAIEKAGREDKDVLIEAYIEGRELTCAVLGNHSDQCTALPPIEIIPHSEFFDYRAKYESKLTEEICPAPLSVTTTQKVTETAIKIHKLLGCDGLTRSDFILTKNNELCFLEVNTIPGLTKMSLCPKAAKAFGISFERFLELQINLALNRQ